MAPHYNVQFASANYNAPYHYPAPRPDHKLELQLQTSMWEQGMNTMAPTRSRQEGEKASCGLWDETWIKVWYSHKPSLWGIHASKERDPFFREKRTSAISVLAVPYVIFHGALHIELFGILISFLLLSTTPTDFDSWLFHTSLSHCEPVHSAVQRKGLVHCVSIQTKQCRCLFQSPSVRLSLPLLFNLIIHWREHDKS